MTTIILYLILITNALAALRYPWVGITLAYLMAILTPHTIWWWAFAGIRPFLWAIVPALAGFLLAALGGKLDYSSLNTRVTKCVGLLWICFTIAYYFGPYVHVVNEFRFYNPEVMFAILQKTYLTYFVAVVLIKGEKRLGVASMVLVLTVMYMTYWSNQQYFQYHKYGRMHGPVTPDGLGIYADENDFAVLFVVGAPFLFYFGQYVRNRFVKWTAWLFIPFSWHAIFLTASRGALVGVGAVLFVFAIRARNRWVSAFVIIAFVAAFTFEAGDVMKSRSETITDYQQEDSASARLDAWRAAIGMMAAHPITGVGFASFGQAFPDFSDKIPRIAHNTFFQVGGEWGVVAGVTYLVLILSTLMALRKNGVHLREQRTSESSRLLYHVNEACFLGLLGFFVCSLFLSLEGYEILYFVLVLSSGVLFSSGYYTAKVRVAAKGTRKILEQAARRRPPRPKSPGAYPGHLTPRDGGGG